MAAPPPLPSPQFIELPISFPTLLAILFCWMLPAALYILTASVSIPKSPDGRRGAVDGAGEEVPLDIERRKEAVQQDEKNGTDRKLQSIILAAVVIPYAWAVQTQSDPTVAEQISGWASQSWAQLADGKVTLHFQIAVVALFIERMCYTWVHTFSAVFIQFCSTWLGRKMGKEPLDVRGLPCSPVAQPGSRERCPRAAVPTCRPPSGRQVVLTIFCINKVLQVGTFVTFYFYVINFASPFESGFSWGAVTRFQWLCLLNGMVIGQGLNIAIYRAIGKAGVYYGYRLGVKVPWVTGFPFSVFPHPQYFGVCCCVLGVNAFCATPLHVSAGWFNLTFLQVIYYIYMGLVEDYL